MRLCVCVGGGELGGWGGGTFAGRWQLQPPLPRMPCHAMLKICGRGHIPNRHRGKPVWDPIHIPNSHLNNNISILRLHLKMKY